MSSIDFSLIVSALALRCKGIYKIYNEPDGTLSGICAWACDADSDEDIEAKLIHFVKTKCGVNTVQMLFALNHCDAFEAAAKKAWPQVKFPAV